MRHAPPLGMTDSVPALNIHNRKILATGPISSAMANTRPPRSAAAKAREYLAVAQWVGRSRRHASKHPIGQDPGDVPTCNIRKRMNLTALPVSSTIANTRPRLIAAVKAWEYLAVAQRVDRWGRHTSYPHWARLWECSGVQHWQAEKPRPGAGILCDG